MFHELTDRGDVHGIHYWTYATLVDRDNHVPLEGPARLPNTTDVTHKRVCLVLEDKCFYALHNASPLEWQPLNAGGGGPGGGPEEFILTVPLAVSVRDLVYITGELTADKADYSIAGHSPVIGAVISKSDPTTATVIHAGVVTGFAGLTPGDDLFLGLAGGIIAPPLPTVIGSVIQKIGHAISATALYLDPDLPIIL